MKVVNKKTHTPTKLDIYIGRPSVLGNPYSSKDSKIPSTIKVDTALQAVNLYSKWLKGKIDAKDPEILEALSQLNPDSVLVCWCKPAICHGDVLINAYGYCIRHGIFNEVGL